jgi:hypothetical protein
MEIKQKIFAYGLISEQQKVQESCAEDQNYKNVQGKKMQGRFQFPLSGESKTLQSKYAMFKFSIKYFKFHSATDRFITIMIIRANARILLEICMKKINFHSE